MNVNFRTDHRYVTGQQSMHDSSSRLNDFRAARTTGQSQQTIRMRTQRMDDDMPEDDFDAGEATDIGAGIRSATVTSVS